MEFEGSAVGGIAWFLDEEDEWLSDQSFGGISSCNFLFVVINFVDKAVFNGAYSGFVSDEVELEIFGEVRTGFSNLEKIGFVASVVVIFGVNEFALIVQEEESFNCSSLDWLISIKVVDFNFKVDLLGAVFVGCVSISSLIGNRISWRSLFVLILLFSMLLLLFGFFDQIGSFQNSSNVVVGGNGFGMGGWRGSCRFSSNLFFESPFTQVDF